ncbi:MAG: hypothetical protein PHI60_01050, partial [Candidatus Omnitrophica bacterium]|nr:hypothetical protein [Candidatus Omnitrophota bacterium]
NSPVDLVEEIARVHGYENIAMTLPRVKPKPRLGEQPDKVALIKDILTGLGLNEVITYSLMDKSLLREFGMYAGAEALEVLNPLSAEQEILRPALIPGVSACVARNLNQKQDYVNIFEVAKAFGLSGGVPSEELRLCIALCGTKSMLLDRGVVKDTAGFLQLKGIIETVFERLGLKAHDFRPSERPSVIDILLAQEKIGMMQKLDQPALARMDIKNKDLFVAELSLERLLFYYKPEKKFSRLPAYPGISRDISLVIKEEITAGQILETVKEEGSVLLRQARISDCYQGKQIPAGFKGLTISCLYRSDERTLTEEEIEPLHSAVFKRLYEKFGAQIR